MQRDLLFPCQSGYEIPTVDSARYLQSANQITISILQRLVLVPGRGISAKLFVWRSKIHCKLWARRRWKDEKT